MPLPHTIRINSAFTRMDLLCVVAALLVLAAAGLPILGGTPLREKRLICANNLHMAGQAFQAFALDHGGTIPWRVGRPQGGSAGQTGASDHWRTLSNYLQSPRLLVCPSGRRLPALSFPTLLNRNVSYLIGSDSELRQPGTLVSGDLDIEGGSSARCSFVGNALVQSFEGLFGVPDSYVARWSATNHYLRGNLLMGDGSVRQTDAVGLKTTLSGSTDVGNNSHSLIP